MIEKNTIWCLSLYLYSDNSPAVFVDPLGKDTLSFQFNLSGTLIGSGAYGFGIVIDELGNIGLMANAGAGGSFTIGATASMTDAEDIFELRGKNLNVGGSGSVFPGTSVGADVLLAEEYSGANFNAGFGVGPGEVHGMLEKTEVAGFNLSKLLEDTGRWWGSKLGDLYTGVTARNNPGDSCLFVSSYGRKMR